jgi:transposase
MAKVAPATVSRIYAQHTERKAKERISLNCPRVLGIEEHTLHKKMRFATTFCDLAKRRVFDVVQGKSSKDLLSFLCRLKGRERVKMVCIDLSSSYRSLIRRFFPNAQIVADRFHVVRVTQHHFMEVARKLAPELAAKKGRLGLLRKAPQKLTSEQKARLEEIFKTQPALQIIYDKMHEVRDLLNQKHQTKFHCRQLSQKFLSVIGQLQKSGFEAMQTLARTFQNWKDEIARMWRFTRNNGITEGFHRKMKLIQRRAYGFRNFENYRLRVLASCG